MATFFNCYIWQWCSSIEEHQRTLFNYIKKLAISDLVLAQVKEYVSNYAGSNSCELWEDIQFPPTHLQPVSVENIQEIEISSMVNVVSNITIVLFN